jgi:putative addiction module killer protein
MSLGNMGDCKSVGDGVLEARVHCGAGYRLYFVREGQRVIVLLCGGDKSSQQKDISHAHSLAKKWRQ